MAGADGVPLGIATRLPGDGKAAAEPLPAP